MKRKGKSLMGFKPFLENGALLFGLDIKIFDVIL
jgi:hypothetical protein